MPSADMESISILWLDLLVLSWSYLRLLSSISIWTSVGKKKLTDNSELDIEIVSFMLVSFIYQL